MLHSCNEFSLFYSTLSLFTLCLDMYCARRVCFTDDPGNCDMKGLLLSMFEQIIRHVSMLDITLLSHLL